MALETIKEKNDYIGQLVRASIYKYSAFASLLIYIPRRAVNEEVIAYTDGKTIRFGNPFFEKFTAEEQAFILLHEGLHVVMRHVMRHKGFNKPNAALWNIVTDCIINHALGLENDNTSADFSGLKPPEKAVGYSYLSELIGEEVPKTEAREDGKDRDWSAENLFKYAKRKINESPNKEQIEQKLSDIADNAQKVSKGASSGSGGSNGESQENDSGGEKSQDSDLLGDMVDQDLDDPVPQHIAEDDLPDADSGRVGDMVWARRVQAAAGRDPNGILKRLLGDLPKPQKDWKKLLRQYVSTQLLPQPKTDWRRPSRRVLSGDCDYFMPNRGRERGVKNIVVFHDASGSCWSDLIFREFLGNVQDIQQKMKAHLTYVTFDADLQSFTEVPYDGRPLKDRIQQEELELSGGGGTSFQPAVDWLKDNSKKVDVAVMFTDGMADIPSGKPKVPFIWCIIDNESFEAPFGKLVNIEESLSKL